jgi:hypothetical protein
VTTAFDGLAAGVVHLGEQRRRRLRLGHDAGPTDVQVAAAAALRHVARAAADLDAGLAEAVVGAGQAGHAIARADVQ